MPRVAALFLLTLLVPIAHCSELLEDVAKFCQAQNFQHITIVCNAHKREPATKKLMRLLNNQNLRYHLKWAGAEVVANEMDSQLTTHYIILANSKSQEARTWQFAEAFPVESSLVLLANQSDLASYEGLERSNALFYVFVQSEWKFVKVTSLKREQQLRVQNLAFTAVNGNSWLIREKRDNHNLTLFATGRNYERNLILDECGEAEEEGMRCSKVSGLTGDFISEIVDYLNLTLITHAHPDDNWGAVNNDTQKWSGVLGNVVTGKADVGLAPWFMTVERVEFLDYIPVSYSTFALAYCVNEQGARDPTFFWRPFTSQVWWAIIALIILITFSWLVFQVVSRKGCFITANHLTSKRLLHLTIGLAFIILQQHYGGVITMQAATKGKPLFSSVDEVLRSSPTWRLVPAHGSA